MMMMMMIMIKRGKKKPIYEVKNDNDIKIMCEKRMFINRGT